MIHGNNKHTSITQTQSINQFNVLSIVMSYFTLRILNAVCTGYSHRCYTVCVYNFQIENNVICNYRAKLTLTNTAAEDVYSCMVNLFLTFYPSHYFTLYPSLFKFPSIPLFHFNPLFPSLFHSVPLSLFIGHFGSLFFF